MYVYQMFECILPNVTKKKDKQAKYRWDIFETIEMIIFSTVNSIFLQKQKLNQQFTYLYALLLKLWEQPRKI